MNIRGGRPVVVDSSAAFSIITGGPDGPALAIDLERASSRSMSAGTMVELALMIEARYGPAGRHIAERFVLEGDIDVVSVDRAAARAGAAAWRRHADDPVHPGLELGDCFTHLLASSIDGATVLCSDGSSEPVDLTVIRHR